MADVNQGNRPLSPHVAIYRWPLNALLSGSHRITGVAMTGSAVLVVWWFLALATSETYFNFVNGLITSFVGDVLMLLSMASLWYHFVNGIRHLIWDTGSNFGRKRVYRSCFVALATFAGLVVITLAISSGAPHGL